MVISQDTVYGDTVTELLSFLRNSATIIDTKSPARTKSTWILSAFPTQDALSNPARVRDFPGFPLIIVESPDVRQSKVTFSRDKRNCTVVVTVMHQGNVADLDTICGQVLKLMDASKLTDLPALGLNNLAVESSGLITRSIDNKKYHQRAFTFTFKFAVLI